MDILSSFIIFVVVPFLVLYLFLRMLLKANPPLNGKLSVQSAKQKWYRLFFFISLAALVIFATAFGLFYKKAQSDIDNSGMGLVLFLPMLKTTVLLFVSSAVAWFLTVKTKVRVNTVFFLIMALFTIPAALLAFCSILFAVLLVV